MYILHLLNSFGFSASEKVVEGRESRQINNRLKVLIKINKLEDKVIDSLMNYMIKLSTNLKS